MPRPSLRPRPRVVLAAGVLSLSAIVGTGLAAYSTVGPEAGATGARTGQDVVASTDAMVLRPNIMLITVDDAAASDLRHLPNIRTLIADQGVTLDNAVAPTPICVPARATLLTGQYAHNHGALGISGRHGGFQSFADHETLPVWLQRAGYDTYFVGKYLNGYGKGGPKARRYVPPGWTRWNGSIDPFTYNYARTVTNRDGRVVRDRRYSTDSFARLGSRMIERAVGDPDPFYLWMNYVAPHNGAPHDRDDPQRSRPKTNRDVGTPSPAKRHRNAFRGLGLPRSPALFARPDGSFVRETRRRWKPAGKRALREAHQQRLESLLAVDEAVGRHLRQLRQAGELENTLVVLTSDNGYFLGEHNLNGKLWFYDEAARVPMVIRGPGVPAARHVRTAVSHADLPATFAAAAGATPSRVVDGVDIRSWLTGPAVRRIIPLAAYRVKARRDRPLYTGVRIGDEWTYVVGQRGGQELYDLRADPHQVRNLARNPAYADVLAEGRRLTRAYRHCAGRTCPGLDQ